MIGNDKALWLLFIVPAVLLPGYVWCFWQKAKALRFLASVELLRKINTSVSKSKQIFKAFLLIAAFVSIVIGMTEPKWNPQPRKIRRKARDICILLDTSRSMLAEDIRPSRLERSRIAIRDLLEALRGDRIAIVTFAGNSSVKCPLTVDYAFVRAVLEDVSTDSNTRGGTLIGDAIRKAADKVFDKESRQYKDIILITDGEDHESFPVQAAEKAAKEGIRIIAIGLGDENKGSRVPVTDSLGRKTFLKYKGEEVFSKLNVDLLRDIVYATEGGRYLSVGPGTDFNLDEIYERLIASSSERRELESATMTRYDEKFQIFLVLAVVLIICEALISERKKA